MALNNGKHIITEIEGVRSTVVEKGLNENRCLFLKELLQQNGFKVKMEKEKAKDGTPLETWILGVTDILFNPVIRVYEQKVFRTDGHPVTPAYWNQWAVDPDLPYWMVTK
jgi:phosphoribosylformylglycinamidine (FGAM) synthase PurS component